MTLVRKGTLASELKEKAILVAKEHRERAAAAQRAHLQDRADGIEKVAQAFYTERMRFLPQLLTDAAAEGEFKWDVWKFSPLRDAQESVETKGTIEGMKRVGEWLEANGFKSTLVLDRGWVQTHKLTAEW